MNIPPIEQANSAQIRNFQFEKIRKLLGYANLHSPFYQRLFKTYNVIVDNIFDWQSFNKIPTTSKDDMQDRNWDFLCVPHDRIIEYTSTSGTLGKPVTIPLTEGDLQRLGYNESISFQCADGSSADRYQLMLTLDRQFMAGIAYYEGIRKMGAGLIRVGPGLPSLQLETIERLKPTALVAVPSFIVKLIEFAQQHHIDLNASSVRKIICIGESVRTSSFELNALGNQIISKWNVKLYSTYASTEMQTAFTECHAGSGGHLHPELIYVEILDDDGNAVVEGELGEVTITTLGVEAMPLIRYRTGDLARLHSAVCGCGRTTPRLGPIEGRKKQMIKLKGTTLYPPAIFDILSRVPQIQDYVVEVVTGNLGTDELRLHVVATGPSEEADGKLKATFQSRIRVVPEILWTTAAEIEKLQLAGGRKIKKFIDNR